GRGLYQTRHLQPAAIAATARIIGEFARKATELEASAMRAIATSAAREAINQEELVRAVTAAAPGLKLEIISGEQEADWIFQGAARHLGLGNAPVLLVDVGGGSSEFILGAGEQKHFRRSFRIGA